MFVCYCDMFSVVNVYLDHLKLCVVCVYGRRYICCGECYGVSNECDEPTSCLLQPIFAHCCEVMYFGCFDFRGELSFLNCDDVCMCVVNKQFELLEFVLRSVYVDLQYDETSLTFTAGSVCYQFWRNMGKVRYVSVFWLRWCGWCWGESGWAAWVRVWEGVVVLCMCVL